jgi:hypothetical protein
MKGVLVMTGKHKEIEALYPREAQWRVIELKLAEARQFFNTLDPAPFHMRELDAEAAQWLIDAGRDLVKYQHIKVALYLPPGDHPVSREAFEQAIHHYFRYHTLKHKQRLRYLFRNGRHALFVGTAFLAFCALLVNRVLPPAQTPFDFVHTSVSILGWVAMWRPIDIFLYEWWPIRQDQKICARLSTLPVELRERHGTTSSIV